MRRVQHKYIQFLGSLVLVLALIRCWVPSVSPVTTVQNERDSAEHHAVIDKALAASDSMSLLAKVMMSAGDDTVARTTDIVKEQKPHPVYSVSSYREEFPDTNDLQLVAAQQWGVEPVKDRADAENRKMELVYVAASPYYSVAKLNNSIPYLVPRAALLLHDIGKAYYDSLVVKGLPIHQFLVSSILRTSDDVSKLRRSNRNATENSCHLYGTTFDIAYNKYQPLTVKGRLVRREVRSDTLKWVLSEVLRDMRKANRCYVKYEVKQGCFHITTR